MKRRPAIAFSAGREAIIPDDMGRRRHQAPSVQKRGKKRKEWTIRYRVYHPDGTSTHRRVHLGYVPTTTDPERMAQRGEITKREAERKADAILHPVNARAAETGEDMPLRTFVAFHWIPRHVSQLGAGTQRKYASHVRAILEALGDAKLSKITTRHVQDHINRMQQSWHTRNDRRMVLSAIFTRALMWGCYEGKNPAKDVYCGRRKNKRAKVILTREQVAALLEILPEPSRTIAQLLDETGIRISEALGLQAKHIDYPAPGLITISQRWHRGDLDVTKSETASRCVPGLPSLSRRVADVEEGDSSPDRFLFDRGDGQPCDDRALSKDQLRPALKQLGFWREGVGWHSFRRKVATEMQAAGATSIETAKALGHARTSMTGEYTVLQPERLREIAEKRRTVH